MLGSPPIVPPTAPATMLIASSEPPDRASFLGALVGGGGGGGGGGGMRTSWQRAARLPSLLVNGPLSSFAGPNRNRCAARMRSKGQGRGLHDHIHLSDRAAFVDADELISRFGAHAAREAARRASRSRKLGNFVHFCRWRQIARMIERLASGPGDATLH